MTLANEWALERRRVDAAIFGRGRLGPYRLGKPLRRTAAGQTVLAIHDDDPRIVELEMLDPVRLSQMEHAVLQDVNHVLGFQHRHVATVLGAGVSDGSVYIARVLHLGRTLAELMSDCPSGTAAEVGPGILYSVADVVSVLREEGPQPGACSIGGFDAHDILVAYDGSVQMNCLGLRGLRDRDRAPEADADSLVRLAQGLQRWLGRPVVASVDREEPAALKKRVRKAHPDTCADRRTHAGSLLRDVYSDRIRREREYFGLSTLH